MNVPRCILTLLLSALAASTHAGVRINAALNTPTMPTRGGNLYLQLSINVPEIRTHDRGPLNIAVVLDRSGSMSEQGKLEYAKSAICALVDQLRRDDLFSLVIYDDVVEVPYCAGPVEDRQRIKSLIREISPRNSTNLGGGMLEGFRQACRNIRREYVNRVVLLSDGLANVGITSIGELSSIAHRYRERGISLTAMGVGLDYAENLMMALAEAGGGNYYFIESPYSIASIMQREFGLMGSVYACKAVIELHLGRGVRVLDVIGHEWHDRDGKCMISLGDLYGGGGRDVTVELAVPSGEGVRRIVDGALQYDEGGKEGQTAKSESFAAEVRYSANEALVEKDRDLPAQAKADVALSTRAVEHAAKAIDEGKMEEANRILGAARGSLQASPAALAPGAAGAAVKDQATRLDQYQSMVGSGTDRRKAKKAIQYENYQTQKQK
ncbi:MAG TPA: VWA domain-containing protein [Bacteroidota bacterium]